MAKKKGKKKGQYDARGYSYGGNEIKKAGVAQKQLKVTSQTHDGLVDLLDQLTTDTRQGVGETTQPIADSKRFMRKVTNVHDELSELGFSEESIQAVIQATGSSISFSVETALDWLCLHLKTEDLPPLFTEGLVREEAVSYVTDPDSLDIIAAQPKSSSEDNSRVTEHEKVDERAFETTVELKRETGSKNEEKHESDIAAKEAQKAWLLEQYQYETEEDEPENDGITNELEGAQSKEEKITLLPEEVRLAELERQLREDEADLNDDAANYMRSKYEVKELQKKVKQLRKQVQGLRNKVARLKAQREKEEKSTEEEEKDGGEEEGGGLVLIFDEANEETEEGDGGEEEGGGLFSMFEEEDAEVKPSMVDDTTDASLKKGGNITDAKPVSGDLEDKKNSLSSMAPSIPKDWTGKTPKKILEEWCQKQKIPKPQYQKLPRNTCHGCRVIVKDGPRREPFTLEQEGPFASFIDAQHFLATEALYALNPTLPLYRLFPPVFRDLWRSWMDREKQEKEAEVEKKRNAKKMKIKNLIDSIPGSSKQSIEASAKATPEGEDIIAPPVLESWEDDNVSEIGMDTQNRVNALDASPAGNKLKEEFVVLQASPKYQSMLKSRKALPMYSYREQLLEMVRENPVTILCAETGAGKTTQGPQFLLEQAFLDGTCDRASILCTQPRRISAISVAERVSDEMADRAVGDTVGYHIRMETKRSSRTKLLFCTTGVVLRRLQDDPQLSGVTHVVVDEVHERQWQTDFLLIALRRLINSTRRDLKVVLMSATLDAKLFCSFFNGAPLLSVPGRTFPVSNYYLEDLIDATNHIIEEGSRYALREDRSIGNTASLWVTTKGREKRRETVSLESEVAVDVSDNYPGYKMSTRRSMDRVDEQVINYDLIQDVLNILLINSKDNDVLLPPESVDVSDVAQGAVLVFLPGLGEIRSLTERLEGSRSFGDRRKFDIIPMHSTLSPKEQRRAFLKPKKGCQKIILATNIAETSITIPDVVCVVDTGLVREVRQNKKSSTSTLVTDWCSRASTKQRSGRAGRVQPGICCRLYSSRTSQYVMKEQAIPELQRVPLEEVCLSILAGKLANKCTEFLHQAPQPPPEEAVHAALRLLQEVGAIDPMESGSTVQSERLTPLGQHLAKLPVHVRLGKMLIFGALFNCVDKILTVAASLSCKSPFSAYVKDAQQAEAKHKAFAHSTSDFLTVCNVYEAYRCENFKGSSRARRFCDQNYLNRAALVEIKDMRTQFLDLLCQIGFVSGKGTTVGEDGGWRRRDEADTIAAYNVHGKKESVVNAVICAGLYPNVAHALRAPGGGMPTLMHGKERVHFHRSSVNSKNASGIPSEWVVFHEKFATHRVYVAATSYVHPFAILLFGGTLVVKHTERKVLVGDWIELGIAAQTGALFRELRREIDSLLKSMIETANMKEDEKGKTMVDGIIKLLMSADAVG